MAHRTLKPRTENYAEYPSVTSVRHQFVNGLRDDIICPLAKDLVNRKPGIPFIKFRSEVANLSGSRLKRTLRKVTINKVEEDEEIERPNKKTKQDRQSLDAQIKTLMEQNRSLSQKVDSWPHFKILT